MTRHKKSNKNDHPKQNKRCFVISPIGDPGTDVRKRTDQIYEYVIKPIMKEKSYEVDIAHQISIPGNIPNQVLQCLLMDELVIADLTFSNPNVTYELGIRHMTQKPVIQIIDTEEKLPFDLFGERTIRIDYRFISSMDECKKQISDYIEAIEKNPEKVHSPIEDALNYVNLNIRGDPTAKALSNMRSELDSMRSELAEMKKNASFSTLGGQQALPKFTSAEPWGTSDLARYTAILTIWKALRQSKDDKAAASLSTLDELLGLKDDKTKDDKSD